MAWVSDHVIRAMGFTHYPDGLTIAAKYHCIEVMHIRGLSWEKSRVLRRYFNVGDNKITLTIGSSVNRMCRIVHSDGFTDDESDWLKEKSCTPPFVMLFFSLDYYFEKRTNWFFEKKSEVYTYDTFKNEKTKIKEMQADIVPRATTALAGILDKSSSAPVSIHPVETTYFGITPDGRTLHDLSVNFSAEISINRKADQRKLGYNLNFLDKISNSLDRQASEFFYDAVNEKDDIKKFLFYFLFIERKTHKDFKGHSKQLSQATLSVGKWKKSIGELSYFVDLEKVQNLVDRFIWCANFSWTIIGEADVEQFRKLKRVRDDMAHGNARRPNSSDVKLVESLAKKLCLA